MFDNGTRRRRWRWLISLVVVVVLLNLGLNPWFARTRSVVVMAAYEWSFERSSVSATTGIRADLPLSESGLYPLMVTFNADEAMSRWLDANVSFTVDYTFADFRPWRGHSQIFEPDDPRYGAYLGAYYLQGYGRALTADEVGLVAQFDQRVLALPALGLGFPDNHFTIGQTQTSQTHFGGHEWTSHRAQVQTNCPDHSPDGFLASYLQFGTPPATGQHYPVCAMASRIDVVYLPEHDLTIGLYVMAPEVDEVDVLHASVIEQVAIIED